MPKTSAHAIFSFTMTSTLARALSLPPAHVLLMGLTAAILDYLIDLGHEENRRSPLTHSVASIPTIFTMILIMASPILEYGSGNPLLARWSWLLLTSILGHLLWDSLTVNGVHIPLIGWVSLASLDSKGVVANSLPIIAAVLAIYIFWPPKILAS